MVRKEIMVYLDHQVHRDSLVPLVLRDQSGPRDSLEILVVLDLMEHQELPDNKEHLAPLVRLAKLVRRVLLATLVTLDRKETVGIVGDRKSVV